MRYAIILPLPASAHAALGDVKGVFYTVHKEVETVAILAPTDIPRPGAAPIKKGDHIGDEHVFAPIFDSLKEMDASKFDTEADALAAIAAWGDAGKGCQVIEVK